MARPEAIWRGSCPGASPLQAVERRTFPLIDSAGAGAAIVPAEEDHVEFLNFCIMFAVAYLLLRTPQKERLAFRLLVVSVLLMVALFSLATRTALLPGVNY